MKIRRRRPFPRTRVALTELDAAKEELGACDTVDELEAAVARLEAAEEALGDAFATDTTGINDPAVARSHMRSLAGQRWIRYLIARIDSGA